MHIAIIGAGAAGLGAARRFTDSKLGFTCEVFEQTGRLGGIWVYVEETGLDEYEVPIHTAMYKDLVTNLPKEMMGYLDFRYPEKDKSFLPHEEVLEFLNSYATHFDLHKYIKYHHKVRSIHSLKGERWELIVEDVVRKEQKAKYFDAVVIASGHYGTPLYPPISRDNFRGYHIHSHNFRITNPFYDKTVLIVGAGPSGCDIAGLLVNRAKQVYISYRNEYLIIPLPDEILKKPEITRINEDGVSFVDGTDLKVDVIIYCTGYKYSFPFLTEQCGISVTDHRVYPLYKHFLNVEHPTMCFLGIPYLDGVPLQLIDLQVCFFRKILNGSHKLPSKEDMLEDIQRDVNSRLARGWTMKEVHKMGPEVQTEYYEDLAKTSGVKGIPPVMIKLQDRIRTNFNRKDRFKIIDDENFIEF